jgi:hypothetical protein
MNIYTFYEPIPQIDSKLELNILDLWEKSWQRFGWTTIVVSPKDIEKNMSLEDLKKIQQLPSVNHKDFDYFCFLRWWYMAKTGGWMCDYDIINFGFTPKCSKLFTKSISILNEDGPQVVYGEANDYHGLCEIFIKDSSKYSVEINNRTHVSDMCVINSLIHKKNTLICRFNMVDNYPNQGPLIHCSNSICQQINISKKSAIDDLYKHFNSLQ